MSSHYSQIPLNFWNESYENEWIIGQSNEQATSTVLNATGQIFLCGPKFCGKKHLAHKMNVRLQFVHLMDDAKIIAEYDAYQVNKEKVIWISSQEITNVYGQGREVSKDVASRLNSMQRAEIFELTDDMLFALLNKRLASIGFVVRNEIINYCIHRMPRTYIAVEECVAFIKKMNRVSLKDFREFFEREFV